MDIIRPDGSQESLSFWNDRKESLSLSFEQSEANYDEVISKLLRRLEEEHRRNEFLKRILKLNMNQIDSMIKYVIEKSSKISGISNVLFLERNNTCMLWFIAKELSDKLEDVVYALEFDLMANFDKLKFDFLLVPEKGSMIFPDKIIELL